ncbi:MAG TPA: sensor histidine kinase [Bacteroidetes bacterium]|nr:sensor histidine kinase [Bacteroidota bacterium]
MNIFFLSNQRKVFSVIILGLIAIASFLYTQYVLNSILDHERAGVELWAKAIEYTNRDLYPETQRSLHGLILELEANSELSESEKSAYRKTLEIAMSDLSNAGLDFIANELIINNRFSVPSVATDEDGNILIFKDIDEDDANTKTVESFRAINNPIEIPVLRANGSYSTNYVFYGQSAVAQSLKYFPYIQFGLLALFFGLIYINISNLRRTEQSNLWVGMAKEAAHQLGTPLSSMFGWIELMKTSTIDPESIKSLHELEEDVKRLQNVAERFNKIGSGPELSFQRVEPILNYCIDYIERRLPRFSKNVTIRRNIEHDLKAQLNSDLFTWAIENLMKNAIDAIDSNDKDAFIDIRCIKENDHIIVEIEDSGKGIEKKFFNEVFNPGFSTKKRGWGLGLSLTRRIVEDYHKGKITILKSSPGIGSTFRISLPIKKAT